MSGQFDPRAHDAVQRYDTQMRLPLAPSAAAAAAALVLVLTEGLKPAAGAIGAWLGPLGNTLKPKAAAAATPAWATLLPGAGSSSSSSRFSTKLSVMGGRALRAGAFAVLAACGGGKARSAAFAFARRFAPGVGITTTKLGLRDLLFFLLRLLLLRRLLLCFLRRPRLLLELALPLELEDRRFFFFSFFFLGFGALIALAMLSAL